MLKISEEDLMGMRVGSTKNGLTLIENFVAEVGYSNENQRTYVLRHDATGKTFMMKLWDNSWGGFGEDFDGSLFVECTKTGEKIITIPIYEKVLHSTEKVKVT